MLGPVLRALPPATDDATDDGVGGGGRLERLVEGWWASTASGSGSIVPDGAVDLLWRPGSSPVVAGPDVVPRPVGLPAGQRIVGLRLRPGVAAELLGDGVHRLVGERVPLDRVWTRIELDRLDDELRAPPVGREAGSARALARAVARRGSPGWEPDPVVVAAVTAIAAGGPVDARGLGPRQFRRRFTEAIGYGPTLFGRIARLDRFTDLLAATPERSLAELAVMAGYYDQAHLNRDCRELLGATPGALRRGP